jgi:GMP synthase-like glutamine amidotransferase
MGGPMSVNDEAEHPWLVEEKALIRSAVERGLPFWGSCLGVQLLAASLGARVHAGPAPEVGVLPVHLTAAAAVDPVFAGLPEALPTLQWHGDTFELPDGAVLLATSPAYPNQAFRVGRAAYGVQFHVEVTPELSHEWSAIPAYVAYADRVLGPGGIERLLAEFGARTAEMQQHGRRMFERWVDLVSP